MTSSRVRNAVAWSALAFIVGLAANGPAIAAAGQGYCAGELLDLSAPVVRVLDGSGSAEAEQGRRLEYHQGDDERAYFEGRTITIGNDDWRLER